MNINERLSEVAKGWRQQARYHNREGGVIRAQVLRDCADTITAHLERDAIMTDYTYRVEATRIEHIHHDHSDASDLWEVTVQTPVYNSDFDQWEIAPCEHESLAIQIAMGTVGAPGTDPLSAYKSFLPYTESVTFLGNGKVRIRIVTPWND